MKQQAMILTSLTFAMLLSETGLSSDLLLFFLVGAVPGTDYNLSSNIMLALYGSAAILIIVHLLRAYGLTALLAKQAAKGYRVIKDAFAKYTLGEA